MTLKERISADMATAMRGKDQARLMPLRMVKATIMNREVEKGRDLDDAEAQQVILSLIKQRRDSIEQFRSGGRADLADKEAAEITVLETYVPPPMDAQAIEALVDEAIRESGASSPKDMGPVMKAVMAKMAGAVADGRMVSDLVRKKLAR